MSRVERSIVKCLLFQKARLLCKGVKTDKATWEKIVQKQNPFGVKRGGLSSGCKMEFLAEGKSTGIYVNFPIYTRRNPGYELKITDEDSGIISIADVKSQKALWEGRLLEKPEWYDESIVFKGEKILLPLIFTQHNRQLAASVYEWCDFPKEIQCKFCVIKYSLKNKNPLLINKPPELFSKALERIPEDCYDGITLNGGLTWNDSNGMDRIVPVVEAIRDIFPSVPIAVEMTPPKNMIWIENLWKAAEGDVSLMMNLEIWDEKIRARIIPGKNQRCPKDLYFKAFKAALKLLGEGRVSTCFVVGPESETSLKEGIEKVIECGVIPSPLAGRYFEDIPNYPFNPEINVEMFFRVIQFTAQKLKYYGIKSTDKAGCVACGMCDLIKDMMCLWNHHLI